MRSIIFSICISMVLLVTNSCSGLPQELTETEKADLLANWSDSAARADLAAEWAAEMAELAELEAERAEMAAVTPQRAAQLEKDYLTASAALGRLAEVKAGIEQLEVAADTFALSARLGEQLGLAASVRAQRAQRAAQALADAKAAELSIVTLADIKSFQMHVPKLEAQRAERAAQLADLVAARADLVAEWAVMAETEGTEKLPEGPAAHAVADLAAQVAATSRGASQRAAERADLAVALVPRWEPLRAESVAADLAVAVADLAAHVAQLEASESELWHRWAAQFVRSREF